MSEPARRVGNAGFSVALCTRNGARFIGDQLESILGQTVPPSELVLSDDASSDDTVARARKIVDAFRSRVPDVSLEFRVIENARALGVTHNFEQAISACRGSLIALSDQDDVWSPDKLARLEDEFDRDPRLLLVFGNARLVDEWGGPLHHTLFDALEIAEADLKSVEAGRAFGVLLRRNLATGATIAFRRSVVDLARPFPSEWVHDEWLAVMAAAHGRLAVLREPTMDYRQHGQNQIGVKAPTLRYKVSRVVGRRGDRNQRLAAQFSILAARLRSGAPVQPAYVILAGEKADFERERESLPAQRIRRWAAIRSADKRGLYARYASRRRLDILRDALQGR